MICSWYNKQYHQNISKGDDFLTKFYDQFNYIILKEESKAPAINWRPFQNKRFPYEAFVQSHQGNWAIVCGVTSGVMVLDIDSKDALKQLKGLGFDLLNYKTPIVRTGKGYHIYFKYDAGFKINNKVGILKNVDFRTQGGYVLAPPSIHPERKTPYQWLKSPDEYPVMDMPTELKAMLSGDKSDDTPKESDNKLNLSQFLGKSKGERDVSLTKAAGYCYGHPYNMTYEEGLDLLHIINSSFTPPLPDKDVVKVAQSIFNKDKQRKEKPQFLSDKGKPIVSNIVDYLLSKYHFIVARGDGNSAGTETLLVYNDGRYTLNVDSFLGNWLFHNAGADNNTDYLHKRVKRNIITAHAHSDTVLLSDILTREKNRLNLVNGVLDLNNMELLEHSPKYIFLSRMPVKYDPEAQCPVWEKFLRTTLPTKYIKTLQEFIGYCLIPDTRFQKALLLYGKGANGKSIVVNTILSLFGEDYSSSIPLDRISRNQFATSQLIGKLVNASSETVSYSGAELDMFKAIVAGDAITVEQKYEPSKMVKLASRLIFASNHMIRSGDDTDGNYRRWIIIPFEKQFKGENADLFLQDKINKELTGVLNWAIVGLKRLYKNGRFTDDSKEMVERMKRYNDSVIRFVYENFDITGESKHRYTARQLYEMYKHWADMENVKAVAGQTFYSRLKDSNIKGLKRITPGNVKTYCGLKIKENNELPM